MIRTDPILPDNPVGGSVPCVVSSKFGYECTDKTNFLDTGIFVTIPKTGSYIFQFGISQDQEAGSGVSAELRKTDGTVIASGSIRSGQQIITSSSVSCTTNEIITIYGKGSTYGGSDPVSGHITFLCARIDWPKASNTGSEVKQKKGSSYEQISGTPLDCPINIRLWEYPYYIDGTILFPNSATLKSAGKISVTVAGSYTAMFSVIPSWSNQKQNPLMKYELRVNDTVVTSGTSPTSAETYSIPLTLSVGDLVELFGSGGKYNDGYGTYYLGALSGLVLKYNQ